jgi:asparagine synthetase B (glutamine-hydrolysing)
MTKDLDRRLLKCYPIRVAKRLAHLANDPVDKFYMDGIARWLVNTASIKQAPGFLSEKLQARCCDGIDLAQLFPCDTLGDFNCRVFCDLVLNLSFGDLAKVGKVAAGQSLLVREPYLDNFLVDHVNHLPETLKVRGHIWRRLRGTAQTKYLLHHTLGRKLLPQEILSKPKGGFTPPMHRWLREYLEGISIDSILSSSIKQAGYFNTAAVKNVFEGYLKNSERSTHGPYMLLSFAVWHRLYIDTFTKEYPTMSLTELLHE